MIQGGGDQIQRGIVDFQRQIVEQTPQAKTGEALEGLKSEVSALMLKDLMQDMSAVQHLKGSLEGVKNLKAQNALKEAVPAFNTALNSLREFTKAFENNTVTPKMCQTLADSAKKLTQAKENLLECAMPKTKAVYQQVAQQTQSKAPPPPLTERKVTSQPKMDTTLTTTRAKKSLPQRRPPRDGSQLGKHNNVSVLTAPKDRTGTANTEVMKQNKNASMSRPPLGDTSFKDTSAEEYGKADTTVMKKKSQPTRPPIDTGSVNSPSGKANSDGEKKTEEKEVDTSGVKKAGDSNSDVGPNQVYKKKK